MSAIRRKPPICSAWAERSRATIEVSCGCGWRSTVRLSATSSGEQPIRQFRSHRCSRSAFRRFGPPSFRPPKNVLRSDTEDRCHERHAGRHERHRGSLRPAGSAQRSVMETTGTHQIAEPYREAVHIRLMPGPRRARRDRCVLDRLRPAHARQSHLRPGWSLGRDERPRSSSPRSRRCSGRSSRRSCSPRRPRRSREQSLVALPMVACSSSSSCHRGGDTARAHRPRAARDFTPPVPAGRGGRGGPPGGLRFWFGFFNTLILALGVAAAGVARAYSLRLRARGASRRSSSRASSPRRASTRCAASSIRTSSSTRSTPSRRSSSAIRAACAA